MYSRSDLVFIFLQVVVFVLAAKDDITITENNNYSPFIAMYSKGKYNFPNEITTNVDNNSSKQEKTRYFCPVEETSDNYQSFIKNPQRRYCLIEKTFKKGEKLICKKEPKPLILESEHLDIFSATCGTKSSRLYAFGYVICVEKTKFKINWPKITRKDDNTIAKVQFLPTYEICYNHSINRVIFTEHRLKYPKMFHNSIQQDKETSLTDFSEKYSTANYGVKNLENLQKTFNAYNLQGVNSLDSDYQPQRLVPAEDFAIEYWKKTTFHMINYAPQHKSKVALWNAINSYVHSKSLKWYDNIGEVEIYTGTWGKLTDDNENPIYLGNDQQAALTIPLFWWKLLYIAHPIIDGGIVIIMNNVDGTKKICKEDKNCDLTKWQIPLDENTTENVYCCNVTAASKHITVMNNLFINVSKYTRVLKLD